MNELTSITGKDFGLPKGGQMDIVQYLASRLDNLSEKVDAIDKRLNTHLSKFSVYAAIIAFVVATAVSIWMGKFA